MSFIPYSNSFRKIKLKDPIHPFKIIKIIFYLIIALIVIGFIYKVVDTKITDAKIKEKGKYLRIGGKKFTYDVYGSGDYTVIFDGDAGLSMAQWRNVVSGLNDGFDGNIFVYDREGYGFNDGSSKKTIEEQAKDLRMILKKAAVSGPYILVGEGYGSLVMTNFAKEYSQSIAGMVLINPINEKSLSDKNVINVYNKLILKERLLYGGSYIGITDVLNKFGLLKDNKNFIDELNSYDKEAFSYHRLCKNYNGAYLNELKNLISVKDTSQEEGLINDRPLALLLDESKDVNMQKELSKLSKSPLVDEKSVNSNGKILSQSNSETIVNQIKAVAKRYKQIKKAEQQNNKQ
ncbi:alpha/beta hydrolase [Clostridium sp. C8-1-8]|uniref:alpha/beta fold hydrolase n=1 Tax=Clostridium sp. C8-1-8 TaxID=2698831 RepID=UPI00136A8A57|nr:alpha/beta hydrolase [Clostridium sp. C8-1-8]